MVKIAQKLLSKYLQSVRLRQFPDDIIVLSSYHSAAILHCLG